MLWSNSVILEDLKSQAGMCGFSSCVIYTWICHGVACKSFKKLISL